MAPPLDPIAPLRAALRGHYDIEREIGQGAFATVYLARDLKHERKVALKVLHADPTSETGELRFIREIRLLARLQHPNILSLHDSGHVEALLYYVMPYVSGETLRDRINRERQLPPGVACNIARDIADALAYAHGQGIIHRDIKPENILLSAGHPMLADFGIARVIDLAGVKQLTRTGMGSPGTPAYMSPEQLLGDKELDGRSDTYSLGCVLFEMLTGKPPFAGKDGFVKRFTEPPPNPSSVRKDLPPLMDDVVATALARSPNDRYQTAQEFVNALSRESASTPAIGSSEKRSAISASSLTKIPIEASDAAARAQARTIVDQASGPNLDWLTARRERLAELGHHAGRWFVVAAVLVALLAFAFRVLPSRWRTGLLGPPSFDPSRIAVLPFLDDSARTNGRVSSGLHSAFERWAGMNLVPHEDVEAVVEKLGHQPRSRAQARELASELGAGWFVWGQSGSQANKGKAQLFDASSGKNVRTVSLGSDATDPESLAAVALDLLKVPDRPAAADGGDKNTDSYPAWVAYGRAHADLARWKLSEAERDFRAAISSDPNYAPARVWLAQLLAWRKPGTPVDWTDQITWAARFKNNLSNRDLLIETALAAMAGGLYPEACRSYRLMTEADSLDFVGWYGLGECQSLDSLVLPFAASPSGSRFRSGNYGAASSYMRALAIEPGAHTLLPFVRLQALLPTSPTVIRFGRDANRKLFAAYPVLAADTIAFVPYPLAEFSALRPNQLEMRQPALDKATEMLLNLASDWTVRSPQSVAAFEALADMLETRGQIDGEVSDAMSALEAVRKAESLAPDPERRFPLAIRSAWLRFKQGNFVAARLLADSILSVAQRPNRADAAALIGLAALTGKIGRTAELARTSGAFLTSDRDTPAQTRELAANFFAFAALGVCSDTLGVLERKLDASIASSVAEDQQPQLQRDLTSRPLSMLAPCTNARSVLRVDPRGDPLLEVQTAYAKHESRKLDALLKKISEDTRTLRPGDLSLDFSYQLAWVRAANGDTAGAITQLDRVLGALPSINRSSLSEAAAAAAAGRAMALRAELAQARGDKETAAHWGRAVSDLWATSDSPLQSVLGKMRALSTGDR
jgi:tRNA A-37 threonylcarbamoyl transferase component Bud32/tetratricopeptide (TPR) repeat protein